LARPCGARKSWASNDQKCSRNAVNCSMWLNQLLVTNLQKGARATA
jgi:hypothetical protein